MKKHIISIAATFDAATADAKIIQSHISSFLAGLRLHPPVTFDVSEAVELEPDAHRI
jgi:hypothetical protein